MNNRKSIAIVKSIALEVPRSTSTRLPTIASPSVSPRVGNTLSVGLKEVPRGSLQQKMQRLTDMRLYSIVESNSGLLTNFAKVPKPNICVSELWGLKEKYLKQTGYLSAYKELKKQHALKKMAAARSEMQILSPYKADLKTRNKVMQKMDEMSRNEDKSGKMGGKNKDGTGKVTGTKDGIDIIIEQCSDLREKNSKFKIQSEKIKKALENFANRRSLLGSKFIGTLKSASQEVLKKNL
jgi:hypothetical protein